MVRSTRCRILVLLSATLICTWFCVSVIGAQEGDDDERSTGDNVGTVTVGGVTLHID